MEASGLCEKNREVDGGVRGWEKERLKVRWYGMVDDISRGYNGRWRCGVLISHSGQHRP